MLVHALLLIAALGAIAAHVGAGWRQDRGAILALLSLDLLLLLLVWRSGDAAGWTAWMREDAFAEWSTTTAFLAASLLYSRRVPGSAGWGRLAALGLCAFCFFVAGEELSWGQRIFAFQPPDIFLEQNYQQEANLHNLLTGREIAGFRLDSRFLIAWIAALYGIGGAALAWLPKGALAWRGAGLKQLGPPPVLLPAFALIAAVELDYPQDLAGEAAEWMLGVCFLLDALLRPETPGRPRSLAWVLLPGSVLLGALMPPLMDRLVFGPDAAAVATAQAELAALAADLPAAIQPDLDRKKRVHKRVFSSVQAGYLRFGTNSRYLEGQFNPAESDAGRRDRKGYFLDPWANPYWLLWQDKGQGVILYSFGPNRRRDLQASPFTQGAGDDIVVVLRGP